MSLDPIEYANVERIERSDLATLTADLHLKGIGLDASTGTLYFKQSNGTMVPYIKFDGEGKYSTLNLSNLPGSGDLVGIDGNDDLYKTTSASLTTLPADQVIIDTIGSATYDTAQDFLSDMVATGRITGGEITDSGGMLVHVDEGTGYVRAHESTSKAVTFAFDWPEGVDLAMAGAGVNYVFARYNAGTPDIWITQDGANNFFDYDKVFLGFVYSNATLHITNAGMDIANFVNRDISTHVEINGFTPDVAKGTLVIGSSGLYLTMTAGLYFLAYSRLTSDAFDSSASDSFYTWYNDGAWVGTPGQQLIDNTQYNDYGTGLAPISNNRYSTRWVYLDFDGEHFQVVYGTLNKVRYAAAEDEQPPANVPDFVRDYCFLVGKIIVQEDVATVETFSPFTTLFSGSHIESHSGLADLGSDDHAQYLRTDGSRQLTGNWDNAAGFRISIDEVRASNGDGLKITDDIGLIGLHVINGGNVGIKNSTPSETLVVDGNISLLSNSQKILFGAAKKSSVTDNGTHMIINTQESGAGDLVVSGGNIGVGGINYTNYPPNYNVIDFKHQGVAYSPKIVATNAGNLNIVGNMYYNDTNSRWEKESSSTFLTSIGHSADSVELVSASIAGAIGTEVDPTSSSVNRVVVNPSIGTNFNINLGNFGFAVHADSIANALTVKGSDGKVGINTAAQSESLVVNGNIAMLSDNQKQYFGAGKDSSVTYNGVNMVFDSQEVGSGDFVFRNGFVGIGTDSPVRALSVHINAETSNYFHLSNSATGATASDGIDFGVLSDGSAAIYHRNNKWIQFGTNNLERMRILADGTVGIGTNTPSGKLEVNGSFTHTNDNQKNYFGALNDASITYDGVNMILNSREVGTGDFVFSGGDVGIGTSAPTSNLTIETPGGAFKGMVIQNATQEKKIALELASNDAGQLVLWDSDDAATAVVRSEGISYFNGGKVGIGTTTMSYGKLQLKQTVNTNVGGIAIQNSADSANLRLWVDSSDVSHITSGTTDAIDINTSGRVYLPNIASKSVHPASHNEVHIDNATGELYTYNPA